RRPGAAIELHAVELEFTRRNDRCLPAGMGDVLLRRRRLGILRSGQRGHREKCDQAPGQTAYAAADRHRQLLDFPASTSPTWRCLGCETRVPQDGAASGTSSRGDWNAREKARTDFPVRSTI